MSEEYPMEVMIGRDEADEHPSLGADFLEVTINTADKPYTLEMYADEDGLVITKPDGTEVVIN